MDSGCWVLLCRDTPGVAEKSHLVTNTLWCRIVPAESTSRALLLHEDTDKWSKGRAWLCWVLNAGDISAFCAWGSPLAAASSRASSPGGGLATCTGLASLRLAWGLRTVRELLLVPWTFLVGAGKRSIIVLCSDNYLDWYLHDYSDEPSKQGKVWEIRAFHLSSLLLSMS